MGERWTHDTAVDIAHSLVPRLSERAPEGERLRRLPEPTITDCTDADLFSLVVPRSRGGHGLGLRSLCEVTRVLGHGCTSSAWTLSFLVLHNWFVVRSGAALEDELLGERPYVLMPCPLAPTGRARPVEGGYVVSGRWQWATGVMHGDWVMVNALVEGRDPPESRFCLAPIADVDVLDVWHTSGMRATGSNDVAAADLFVPAHRTVASADLRADRPPGADRHPEPWVRYPLTPVLVLVAASPALGAAEAAVDRFRDHVAARVLPYSAGDRQADQAGSQIRLADARATVRAARLVWQDAIAEVSAVYDAGGTIPRAERGRFRLAAAHTVRLCRQAIGTALEGAGAGVYSLDSPLQRIQRDVETLKGHVVYDWDRTAQLAGKLELGVEPGPADML
jgi:3-hydroxy-9,10-secoandrosta-1,3,5(10)-triene-9,17-dione monooxygenase